MTCHGRPAEALAHTLKGRETVMPDPIKGSCMCGAVHYETDPPTLFCVHCHCRFCRRAHGAAFVTWLGVREERFRISSGEDQLRWYRSSEQSRRGFCGACGTTLLYVSTVAPGEVHIALATVVTPIDREPKAHVFFDQAVPWVEINDSLRRLTTDSKQLEMFREIKA